MRKTKIVITLGPSTSDLGDDKDIDTNRGECLSFELLTW